MDLSTYPSVSISGDAHYTVRFPLWMRAMPPVLITPIVLQGVLYIDNKFASSVDP